MRIALRRMGKSKGIIIPAAMLTQAGLETETEVSVVDGVLVVRAPSRIVRAGWAAASKALAEAGDDKLLLPEFANVCDAPVKPQYKLADLVAQVPDGELPTVDSWDGLKRVGREFW